MDEHESRRAAFFRVIYVAICGAVLFVSLLPLDAGAGRWPGPDVILCLTIAWVIRRPNYVPTLLVAAVFLCADLLLMRPPGLAAAINLLVVEFLRSRAVQLRSATVVQDWMTTALMIALAAVVFRLAQWVAMLPNPPLIQDVVGVFWSIAVYPVVVFLSVVFLSVRRVAPGETATGRGVL
ncbi:MAG: rod shape-determining protein MreD [Brevirhabdus sp.]